VQLIANLSLFIDFCVNLLNRDTNQLHIVCPFEGHLQYGYLFGKGLRATEHCHHKLKSELCLP